MREIKSKKDESTAQSILQVVNNYIATNTIPTVDIVTKIMYLADKQMVLDIGRRCSALEYFNLNGVLTANITQYSSVTNKHKTATYFKILPDNTILPLAVDDIDGSLTRRGIELLSKYSALDLLELDMKANDFAFQNPRPDGQIELTAWFADISAEDRLTLIDYIATETQDGFNL